MAQEMMLGLFTDRVDAENAIQDLESHGYNAKDISIIMRDRGAAQDLADTTGSNVAEGAVSGATTGGVVGAIAGLLIGVGAITIPGIGGLLVGGPIAAAFGLTGAAAMTASGAITGALAGGLVGALVGLGVPEEEARTYETRVREGAILLAVPVDVDRSDLDARSILQDHGADQIRTVRSPSTVAG